jgi:hypothetical protein
MTNKEKIAHLESMLKQAVDMIAYCEKKIAKDENAWTAGLSLESFKKDVAALKYALKGLQLMQDLINDQGEEGGDYGF